MSDNTTIVIVAIIVCATLFGTCKMATDAGKMIPTVLKPTTVQVNE